MLLLMTAVLLASMSTCGGHGRLMDPPARNSMWRLGFPNPVNYNDNELYCGGRVTQWARNKGKCGVCGDPYHLDRPHEVGGKYANGIISRDYKEGDVINLVVHITANHQGYFEFRICPMKDPKKEVTQKCLDRNLLQIYDHGPTGPRYYLEKGKSNQFFNYSVVLPPGLTCKHCVMQWKYRTANTWDKDPNGKYCVGCGPQEEFYNCADVSIKPAKSHSGKPLQNLGHKNIKTTNSFKANVGENVKSGKPKQGSNSNEFKNKNKNTINRNKKKYNTEKNTSPYAPLKNASKKLAEKLAYLKATKYSSTTVNKNNNKTEKGKAVPYSLFWDPSRKKLVLLSNGQEEVKTKKSKLSKEQLISLSSSKRGDFLHRWKLARLRQLGVLNPDSWLGNNQHSTAKPSEKTKHALSSLKLSKGNAVSGYTKPDKLKSKGKNKDYKNDRNPTKEKRKKSQLHDKLPQWLIKALRMRNKSKKSQERNSENARISHQGKPRDIHYENNRHKDNRKYVKTTSQRPLTNPKPTATTKERSKQDDESLIRRIVKVLLQSQILDLNKLDSKESNIELSELQRNIQPADQTVSTNTQRMVQPSHMPRKQHLQVNYPKSEQASYDLKSRNSKNNYNEFVSNTQQKRFHSLGQSSMNFGERNVEIQPYSGHIFDNNVMVTRNQNLREPVGNGYRGQGRILSSNHQRVLPTTSRLLTSLNPFGRRKLSSGSYNSPALQNSNNLHLSNYQRENQLWRPHRRPKPVKYDNGNTNSVLVKNNPNVLTSRSSWQGQPYRIETPVTLKRQLICKSLVQLGGGMDKWCNDNCNANYCPSTTCVCTIDQPRYRIPAISSFSHKFSTPNQSKIANYGKPRRLYSSRNKSKSMIGHLNHGHNSYFHKRSILDYGNSQSHNYPQRYVLTPYPSLDQMYFNSPGYSSFEENTNTIGLRPKESGFMSYDNEVLASENLPNNDYTSLDLADSTSGVNYQNFPDGEWNFAYDPVSSTGENIWTVRDGTANVVNTQRYFVNPNSRLGGNYIDGQRSGSDSVRTSAYSRPRHVTRPSSLSDKQENSNNIRWYELNPSHTDATDNNINSPNVIKYNDNGLANPADSFIYDNSDDVNNENKSCRAIGLYAGLTHFDQWCTDTCLSTICPLMICKCDHW